MVLSSKELKVSITTEIFKFFFLEKIKSSTLVSFVVQSITKRHNPQGYCYNPQGYLMKRLVWLLQTLISL